MCYWKQIKPLKIYIKCIFFLKSTIESIVFYKPKRTQTNSTKPNMSVTSDYHWSYTIDPCKMTAYRDRPPSLQKGKLDIIHVIRINQHGIKKIL